MSRSGARARQDGGGSGMARRRRRRAPRAVPPLLALGDGELRGGAERPRQAGQSRARRGRRRRAARLRGAPARGGRAGAHAVRVRAGGARIQAPARARRGAARRRRRRRLRRRRRPTPSLCAEECPPGAVPPHLRVALTAAGDRRPEDFPSGVIEQAAFEVCAAPKRLLIARFLVRLAEEDAGAGRRRRARADGGARRAARRSGASERSATRAVDLDPAHSAAGGGGGAAGGYPRLRGRRDLRRPADETLDDPVTAARARRAGAGARAGERDAERKRFFFSEKFRRCLFFL